MTTQASNKPAGRVTMADVARRAGVSVSTVSLVLNDRTTVQIADLTRQKVRRAAEELEFRPNRLARSLRMQQADTVGVITNRVIGPLFAGRMLSGLQGALVGSGVVPMLIETDDDPASNDAAVTALIDRGVAALVFVSIEPTAVHPSPLLGDTRTIYLNCWPAEPDDSAVLLADEYAGGLAAASAVVRRGHRRTAYLGGPPAEYAAVQRSRAYLDATGQAGLDPAEQQVTFGDYTLGSGYAQARAAFSGHRPTALVCGNDFMAIGAMLAMRDLGVSVPDEVSIVGFDDVPDIADGVQPALTTVELPHAEMGRRAGEILLGRCQPQGRELVPCDLVERRSLQDAPQDAPGA
ncbi:MAG: LacI family DNA-binding transcriptional regulator [Quadrisphaera sp.]